jgi:hypothetical protein
MSITGCVGGKTLLERWGLLSDLPGREASKSEAMRTG